MILAGLAYIAFACVVAVAIARAIRIADEPRCPDTVPAWLVQQVEL